MDRMVRHMLLNHLPSWVHDQGYIKSMEYRPQISWLPLVSKRGIGKVLPQDVAQGTVIVEEGQVPSRKKSKDKAVVGV